MPSITVTDDLARIELDVVHRWLSTDAYWALGRSRETVEAAARGSRSFGALRADGLGRDELVGYARVVTDGVTFAWLCDVYVAPDARGEGVGSALVQAVLDALAPMGLTRVMLATGDAHALYERHGFAAPAHPEWLMALRGAGAPLEVPMR